MTYVPNKPDSGPSPALDAPNIQGNYASFATIFARNHTAINNVNNGDHETIIFENQGTTTPSTVKNGGFIFANDATSKGGTQPQLWVKIPKYLPNKNNSSKHNNRSMQLTFNQVNIVGPNQYQSFLIGGNLIYFGKSSVGSTAGLINILITLVPAPTKLLTIIATANKMTTGSDSRPYDVVVIPDNVLNDRFRIISQGNTSAQAASFGWVAIAQA